MKSSLDEVTRFATLLTTNPSTEELLLTLLRDFLSEQQVIAVEVQILSPFENLVLRHSAGAPINGSEIKSSESVATLIANESIYSDLAKFGSIYNPKNHVTLTAITVDTSLKGFYLFQHNTTYEPAPDSGHYLQALSSLITIYLISKYPRGTTASFLGNEIKKESVSKLSARQLLIIAGMIDGKTNHELSVLLGFSVSTIRHETMAIFKTLGVSDRKEAAKVAVANALL